MHHDLRTNRSGRIAMTAGLVVVLTGALYAHTYVGLNDPTVRARIESPNSNVADLPQPIPGTADSLVCVNVRNASEFFDPRITAIGFDLPDPPDGGPRIGFRLIESPAGFHLIEGVFNVPERPDAVLDFAIVTGHTFGGGRPDLGLPRSLTRTRFCVVGPFDQTLPIERMIDHGVLRFQRVGADGEAGDIAVFPQ